MDEGYGELAAAAGTLPSRSRTRMAMTDKREEKCEEEREKKENLVAAFDVPGSVLQNSLSARRAFSLAKATRSEDARR